MAGHRSFSDLTRGFSAERKARVAEKIAELRAEMELAELREALHITQAALAKIMKVKQPAIAKLEKRRDIHVSNIKRYIESLGGQLEITATIHGKTVKITNFLTHERPKRPAAKRKARARAA